MNTNKNSQNVDPTASNLAKHFAWKERIKKEQHSVYTSLEKWVSMGALSKLPLKEEEIMRLTPTAKIDPYQIIAKLKESQNETPINYRQLNSITDKVDHEKEKKE